MLIADLDNALRRPDDVGEHNGGEHAIELGLLVLQRREEPIDGDVDPPDGAVPGHHACSFPGRSTRIAPGMCAAM